MQQELFNTRIHLKRCGVKSLRILTTQAPEFLSTGAEHQSGIFVNFAGDGRIRRIDTEQLVLPAHTESPAQTIVRRAFVVLTLDPERQSQTTNPKWLVSW